jgi:hypothetical protein
VTRYQVFLLVILLLWPLVIMGVLFFMSRLETYVNRSDAQSPEEAGLAPVAGRTDEKEVRIRFGDEVVPEPAGAEPALPSEAMAD